MKPPASLSLDLDNLWAYIKIHGERGWKGFPSYLDVVVPRILRILSERAWRVTFFIVGQDAAMAKNRESIAAIAAAGHEIGNHSFHHEPWLHRLDRKGIDRELELAEGAIAAISGKVPTGFRGPGFAYSQTLTEVLLARGYAYDASTFPTFIGPLARWYYLRSTSLLPSEAEERKDLFGTFTDGFRPNHAYALRGGLLEIPVTTMPVVRAPIHFSYVHYLDAISPPLARAYFKTALRFCRLTRTTPSLLLHPLDFLGVEDSEALAFFPGMRTPRSQKLATIEELLDIFGEAFAPQPLGEHAALRNDSGANRADGDLGAGAQVQLGEDVRDMVADRLPAKRQPI